MRTVDVVIIGSGPGGYACGLRAAELGSTVALIERDDVIGGTCLNRGCIPSKALLTAAHHLDAINDGARLGIHASLKSIDYAALGAYRDKTVTTMREGLTSLLEARGITVLHDTASFNAAERHSDGRYLVHLDDDTISARDVVLATGSSPRCLDTVPFGGSVLDSTAALKLETFPKTATIIGSGAVALEFASLWHTAGCDVTMVIRKDRVLSGWEKRVGVTLTRELKRRGITIIDHADVTGYANGTLTVTTADQSQSIDAGEVTLVAIGREPNTDTAWHLDLDERHLVTTDAYGQTSTDHVWAVGDITQGPALAHRAFAQGITVAERISGVDTTPVDNATIPQMVFSLPEAACVGLTLDAVKQRNNISEATQTIYPTAGNARMMMAGETGTVVLVSGRATGDAEPCVLGVHMVASHASELIAEAEQLVAHHVPVHQAAGFIHPHPTFSEMLGETLLKADGRPLHMR